MNNNCLYNAAYMGFVEAVSQSWNTSTTSADYADLQTAATAFATEVDSRIAFDSTITTGNGTPTMLVSNSNTIQSNTQMKPQLLSAICRGQMAGRYTKLAGSSDYDSVAAVIVAMYTRLLGGLVSP